jgi:hypothetical protein
VDRERNTKNAACKRKRREVYAPLTEHPDYAHFHDVAADNFDPQVINRAALNDALNALAGKWRRNPRKT